MGNERVSLEFSKVPHGGVVGWLRKTITGEQSYLYRAHDNKSGRTALSMSASRAARAVSTGSVVVERTEFDSSLTRDEVANIYRGIASANGGE